MTTKDEQWRLVYKAGAVSAFLALLTMLTEIFLTALPDGARVMHSIDELYTMYNRNWFMAMRYMGLINIVASTLLLPVSFALYGLHREKLQVYAGFALLISIIGYAIFMSDNAAFPLLSLSQNYVLSGSELEKNMLLAAGEALFADGASHTPGTFPGFLLAEISSIIFSVIIIKGGMLKRTVGFVGLISFTFLLIFEVISSFVPSLYDEAMIFAMIEGICALAWYVMIGLGLLKYSKNKAYGLSH